jgi:hypothetical protein
MTAKIVLLIAVSLVPLPLSAANLVDSSELTSTSIEITTKKGTVTKDIFCHNGLPGLARQRGDRYKFTSFKEKIKKLKKKGAPKPKIKKFRVMNRLGKEACAEAPQPTPTPTPTPIPPVDNPYFDFTTGAVKEAGKIKFEIPLEIDANLFRGEQDTPSTCSCHGKGNPIPQNLTFPVYREKTSQEPMLFNENSLTDEDLADIVAWLNRSAK